MSLSQLLKAFKSLAYGVVKWLLETLLIILAVVFLTWLDPPSVVYWLSIAALLLMIIAAKTVFRRHLSRAK